MSEITFLVPGTAVPKGSRSYFRGRSVESAKGWPDWKTTVQGYALEARSKQNFTRFRGPVTITVTFMLPKPKRAKVDHHMTRPDLDKLVRGVCDALTGILYDDDSQVDVIMAFKRYVRGEGEPAALIRLADSADFLEDE